MGGIDFARINAHALDQLESLLEQWLPGGSIRGHEYETGDLSGGQGDSLRVNLGRRRGLWKDFAAGDDVGGSDPISLYAAINNMGLGEAAKELGDQLLGGMEAPARRRPPPKPKEPAEPEWLPVMPVPDDAQPAGFYHARLGEASQHWTYRDTRGRILLHVARFDEPGGGKQVLPRSWDGQKWRWGGIRGGDPRPLYGLETLAGYEPTRPVVLVEGEKTAEAARKLLPTYPVLSWLGGAAAAGLVSLGPIAERPLILIPDADHHKARRDGQHNLVIKAGDLLPWEHQPGAMAMEKIAEAAALRHACQVRMVDTREMAPAKDGWDLEDGLRAGWDRAKAAEWLRDRVQTWVPMEPEPEHDMQPEPDLSEWEQAEEAQDTSAPAEDSSRPDDDDKAPPPLPKGIGGDCFRCLGHDHGRYYYLSRGAEQVVELSAGGHSKLGLLQLAPMMFWEREFPAKGGADWDMAANALITTCHRAGVYDPRRVRGRGCWWDSGRLIMHMGDHLQVDGKTCRPASIASRWIYEAGPALDLQLCEDPLPAHEAKAVLDMAKRFSWERPASAALLAGWVALAPICGALNWRPHIWITGGAGSGKSTIQEHFLAPLLGGMEIQAQGNSTEAGIRQTLRADARPVLMDEGESNNQKDADRIQAILSLIRQSSSESGAQTLKGSAGGLATSFHVRSMFALSSINVGIQQQADHSRIAVLNLRGSAQYTAQENLERAKSWPQLEADLADMRSRAADGYANRLIARTVSMIPTIRQNIRAFVRAAAEHFRSQRLGDQYGTLLAGAYSLVRDNVATVEQAATWIQAHDWSAYTETSEVDEAEHCLSSIMQAQIQVDGTESRETLTIGELAGMLRRKRWHGNLDEGIITGALARNGLKMVDGWIYIANNSEALKKLLRDRPWATDWKGYLRRIRNAEATHPTRFAAGHNSRATRVPASILFEEAAT